MAAMITVSAAPGYFPGPARTRYSLKQLPGPGKYPGAAFTMNQKWPGLAEMMIMAETVGGRNSAAGFDNKKT